MPTERKKVEDALRSSERRFHLLFENMLDGFAYCKMLYDDQHQPVDFIYLNVNSAFEKLTGLKNVVGKRVTEVIPGIRESYSDLFATYSRVALTGVPQRFEFEFKPLDAWFNISVYSTEKEHFVAVFDNITNRKRSEAEIAHLASFAELDPNPILELDADGNVKYTNPATRTLFPDLTKSGKRHPFLVGYRTLVTGLRMEKTNVVTRELSIGNYHYLQTMIFMSSTDSVRIYGRDITDLKKAQQKAAEYERLAYLGKLAGTIAHEIRNPLATIDTSAFYLERTLKDADSKTREHLERIRSGVKRTATIITKLLEHARMKEPDMTEIDLMAFIQGLTKGLPKAVEVALDFPRINIMVAGDAEQLRMALGNIFKNAVEVVNGKGRLSIVARRKGHEAEIAITDTGPGISAENMGRLFEPLFTTKQGGVGFGLAIAKAIIERHNGAITAQSEPGKGATFLIRLPLSGATIRTK